MPLARRDLLAALAGTAAAAAAGCLDDGDASSAGFADWVPVQDGGALAMYADVAALRRVMEAPESAQSEFPEDAEDPVLGILVGALLVYALSSLRLAGTGLSGLLDTSGSTDNGTSSGDGASSGSGEFESTIEEYVGANDVRVLRGDVVVDEITATLTEEPEGFSLKSTYERTGQEAGYDLYEPADGGSGNGSVPGTGSAPTVAVGGDAIVVGDADPVRSTVRAHSNGSSRAVDEFDDFGWLLEETGDGDLRLASYQEGGIQGSLAGGTNATENGTLDGDAGTGDGTSDGGSGDGNSSAPSGSGGEGIQRLGTPTGVAGSFSFSTSGVSSTVAVTYSRMTEQGREEFRSRAGATADSSSVQFGDDRLTATAEYSASFE